MVLEDLGGILYQPSRRMGRTRGTCFTILWLEPFCMLSLLSLTTIEIKWALTCVRYYWASLLADIGWILQRHAEQYLAWERAPIHKPWVVCWTLVTSDCHWTSGFLPLSSTALMLGNYIWRKWTRTGAGAGAAWTFRPWRVWWCWCQLPATQTCLV